MSLVLEYVYVSSVDISQENVWQLLVSADHLCLQELVELCCDFLRNTLAVDNCIGVMRLATAYSFPSLERDARWFVMRNFVEVSEQSDELLQLSAEELRDIIAADDLNVRKEEVVFGCIIRWLNYDIHNRRANMLELFKKLRLGLCDKYFVQEDIIYHPNVIENRECYDIVTAANMLLGGTRFITLEMLQKSIPDFCRPRIPHDVIFSLGGWTKDGFTNDVETYDMRTCRWIKAENVDLNGPRAFHGSAVIGFNIYLLGGCDGYHYKNRFNSCYCFNVATKTWREVAPMNTRRSCLSVAVLDELVYAVGGCDGHEVHNTAERYDYRSNQWSMIAPMNIARSYAGAAALDGKIYVVGGYNGVEYLNSAEVYDADVNQWTLIKGMKLRRSGLSCVAYHGCLYAIGGFNGHYCLSSVEKYNPTTGVWIRDQIFDMYRARAYFSSVVMDDKIFIIGGHSNSIFLNDVQCYDESTNEWIVAGSLYMKRLGQSTCVVTSLPNVCDYIRRESVRDTNEQR
jgi:kelch-like protein 10